MDTSLMPASDISACLLSLLSVTEQGCSYKNLFRGEKRKL